MKPTCQSLVEAHLDALLAYARAWTRDADQAQEVLQRTFLKAFEKLDQLREPKAARSWLISILRNEIGMEHRARSRFEVWESEDFEESLPLPEEEVFLSPSLLAALPRAIDQLPDTSRRILLLRFQEELGYDAIATHMGVPIGTVMSRLHRAKAALKALLLEEASSSEGQKA